MRDTYVCDYCHGYFKSESPLCRRCQQDATPVTVEQITSIWAGTILPVPTPALDKQVENEHKALEKAKPMRDELKAILKRFSLGAIVLCALGGIARADVPEVSQYPSLFRLAYSGALCALAGDRLDALDEVKAQDKLDRESGVVDLSARTRLRYHIADLDARAVQVRKTIKEEKAQSPLACSIEKVGELLTCMSSSDGACASERWQQIAKEANELGGY